MLEAVPIRTANDDHGLDSAALFKAVAYVALLDMKPQRALSLRLAHRDGTMDGLFDGRNPEGAVRQWVEHETVDLLQVHLTALSETCFSLAWKAGVI